MPPSWDSSYVSPGLRHFHDQLLFWARGDSSLHLFWCRRGRCPCCLMWSVWPISRILFVTGAKISSSVNLVPAYIWLSTCGAAFSSPKRLAACFGVLYSWGFACCCTIVWTASHITLHAAEFFAEGCRECCQGQPLFRSGRLSWLWRWHSSLSSSLHPSAFQHRSEHGSSRNMILSYITDMGLEINSSLPPIYQGIARYRRLPQSDSCDFHEVLSTLKYVCNVWRENPGSVGRVDILSTEGISASTIDLPPPAWYCSDWWSSLLHLVQTLPLSEDQC